MRKIILDLAVSLDGFIEGPNGETDWCIMDEDMDFDGFLGSIDSIFYGRVSYQSWGNFQPDEDMPPSEKKFWNNVHSKRKYVFTKESVPDENVTVIHGNLKRKIDELRNQNGKDIWLYGGAKLIKTFVQLDLIDIYRISVHPVVLGSGKPLFEDIGHRVYLKLIDTKKTRSGVVQLFYRPESSLMINRYI